MKNSSKRRHPFVVVYLTETPHGDPYQVFVGMLQSPECPEKYAWYWALKSVRDDLIKYGVPFEYWNRYRIYPINECNCSQFNLRQVDEKSFKYINVANSNKKDDEATIKMYNEIRSKWKPTIK